MRPNRQYMAALHAPRNVAEHIGPGLAWAAFLEENKDKFQRTIEMPMGRMLGCGLFGCVFSSTTPWVVKVTRDHTEGPVWAYMAELLQDPELDATLNAFLRVKDVIRIRPDVLFDGRTDPVFGIVREEAVPVLKEPGVLTEHTLSLLGITADMLEESGLGSDELPHFDSVGAVILNTGIFPSEVQKAYGQLFVTLSSIRKYRNAAIEFHKWRGRLHRKDYYEVHGVSRREAEYLADQSLKEMLNAASRMLTGVDGEPNQFGTEMGHTLSDSMTYGDLAFQDLHLLNIGWRVHSRIGKDVRPPCMVILDPGAMATPYEPEIRQAELLENVGRLLRNGGMRIA